MLEIRETIVFADWLSGLRDIKAVGEGRSVTLQTKPLDPTEHLDITEAQAAYIKAAFEDGDPGVIAAAIGDVAKARGMTRIARDAGISREVMYKSFNEYGNPTLATLTKVLKAVGMKLAVEV